MSILGNAGSLYMIFLIMLLIIGFGLFGLWLIEEAFDVGQKAINPKGNTSNPGRANTANVVKKGLNKTK